MGLFDLHGKTAVITGSSKGIGRAIAEQLAAYGAKVVISSRKVEPCEEVAAGIRAKGGQAVAIACHIGHKAQLEDLVAQTHKAFGGIDILVCNAAINPYYGPLLNITDEAFDRIMASNVRSNIWLCNLVQPEMAARKDGSIIIISSIGGLRGTAVLGAYGISKAADMQLARNLAVEWGPMGIRVNCIAPGLVKTDFARALYEDPARAEARINETPLRRLGDPIDIAGCAVMLAGDGGRFITGQAIVIDGGVTI